MKKDTFRVMFLSTEEAVTVRAFTENEAIILARAEQIKAGKKWNGAVAVQTIK